AAENTRELDTDLVDAQETRRILDRLYGYEVSPVLWKKVMPRLSAGRVQSVATRGIVERERERMAFVAAGYWDITAVLATAGGGAAGACRPAGPRRTGGGSRRAVTSVRWVDSRPPAPPRTRWCSTRPRRAPWPVPWKAPTSPSTRSSPSRTPAAPTRRS